MKIVNKLRIFRLHTVQRRRSFLWSAALVVAARAVLDVALRIVSLIGVYYHD